MSEIPSRLSRWEPPRSLKIAFVALAGAAVLALLVARLWSALSQAGGGLERQMGAERLDAPAPDFRLVDRRGRVVTLASYRGRTVFLNLWATWCPPCRDEMPSLEALARSVQPESAVFLAVSVDETWAPVERFFAGRPLPFEVFLDPEKKVSDAYGTRLYPESYVIDAQGRLVYKFAGPRDWSSAGARALLERAGARLIAAPAGR